MWYVKVPGGFPGYLPPWECVPILVSCVCNGAPSKPYKHSTPIALTPGSLTFDTKLHGGPGTPHETLIGRGQCTTKTFNLVTAIAILLSVSLLEYMHQTATWPWAVWNNVEATP